MRIITVIHNMEMIEYGIAGNWIPKFMHSVVNNNYLYSEDGFRLLQYLDDEPISFRSIWKDLKRHGEFVGRDFFIIELEVSCPIVVNPTKISATELVSYTKCIWNSEFNGWDFNTYNYVNKFISVMPLTGTIAYYPSYIKLTEDEYINALCREVCETSFTLYHAIQVCTDEVGMMIKTIARGLSMSCEKDSVTTVEELLTPYVTMEKALQLYRNREYDVL